MSSEKPNFDQLQPLRFTTPVELESTLRNHQIDVDIWGTGETKTVHNLFDELQVGESQLFIYNEKLIRYTRGVFIEVMYQSGDTLYRLIEDRQVFADGRERRRSKDNSVSEKMLPGEENDIEGLMRRALHEELPQISERLGENWTADLQFNNITQVVYDENSKSYPGFRSYKDGFRATVQFNDEQYSPEGYVETNKTMTTYFVWEPLQ